MPTAITGAALTLWVVFAVSAAGKVRSVRRQRAFAASLRPLGILPDRLVAPTALAVTGAEVAVALGLGCVPLALAAGAPVQPIATAALTGAAVLLAVLTTGVALALRRGSGAPCACFGATERPLSRRHLVRNGLLLLLAAGGAASADHLPGAAAEVPSAALAGLVGAVAGLLLVRLDDLVDLFAPTAPAAASRAPRS
jgi:hypothetical protein